MNMYTSSQGRNIVSDQYNCDLPSVEELLDKRILDCYYSEAHWNTAQKEQHSYAPNHFVHETPERRQPTIEYHIPV